MKKLKIGDKAPDFTLEDQGGNLVSLQSLLEAGPLVLFFYPKAFTPGCTAESCSFRDESEDFAKLGAKAVGISADKTSTQKKFHEKYHLGYPLLSDPGKKVARAYGVARPGPIFNKRTTFVISKEGIILDIIHSEFAIGKHIKMAKEALSKLAS